MLMAVVPSLINRYLKIRSEQINPYKNQYSFIHQYVRSSDQVFILLYVILDNFSISFLVLQVNI